MNIDQKAGWNLDYSYARLPAMLFSCLNPTAVRLPELSILNAPLATALGLDPDALQRPDGISVLAGNRVPEHALPLAQAYAGHQFGYFTMLGDGRALLLGEQITPQGERFDVQLKGSGRTPYSRGGDGRAALGPMMREYVISEAMHALGIPTTRSLAVVTTGETVLREPPLPGAILTRVASSHIRVGTFQYVAKWGSVQDLRALADYTVQRHYPDIGPEENRYLNFLREAIKRQARLIAQWQLVGFVHGVMNTDNMAISGETIDYGPCAFLDAYDPKTRFSSIDTRGRYAYGNQPAIAQWNLARLAETLLPLLHHEQDRAIRMAEDAVSGFMDQYHAHWVDGMREKLGLANQEDKDESLIEELLRLMQDSGADFTNTFRALTLDKPDDTTLQGNPDFPLWLNKWKARFARQRDAESIRTALMRRSNPAVIPRNHRVEAALDAVTKQGDLGVMKKLLAVLSHPYSYTPEQNEYAALPEPSACPYRTFCGT